MLRFARAAVFVVLALVATAVSAQNYRSGSVKLIVSIPAGGVTDVMAGVIGLDRRDGPYRGAVPALKGFRGNEVSVMIINLSSAEEHAKGGKVRLVAAAMERRVPALPDLPAISETVPGFNTSVWFGLWGPG